MARATLSMIRFIEGKSSQNTGKRHPKDKNKFRELQQDETSAGSALGISGFHAQPGRPGLTLCRVWCTHSTRGL
jgi:hypothetical protein